MLCTLHLAYYFNCFSTSRCDQQLRVYEITVYYFYFTRGFTWCTRRMSTLDLQRKEDTVASRIYPPQGTAKHHFCLLGYQKHILGPRQGRWNLLSAYDRDVQSSGTHDTLRSIQTDSHSLRASSALSYVTWQSRQHRELHGRGYFFWKQCQRTHVLHIQCRTYIPHPGRHFCIWPTLDYAEGKGSLHHLHGDRNTLHPLYLYEANGE